MKKLALITLLGLASYVGHVQAKQADNLPGLPAQSNKYFLVQGEKNNLGVEKSSPQQAEFFFTGKPYDSDIGSFIFKYRSYDPKLNRWTSVDPSGFPDGLNNLAYAPILGSQLDPYGLDTITYYGGDISNSSGALGISWSHQPTKVGSANQVEEIINWTISGAQSGWVTQFVSIQRNVYNDSDGSPYTISSSSYFEAWRVTNGVASGRDIFKSPSFADSTYGDYTMTGVANFYADSQVSGSSPADWGSHITAANGLPSYDGSAPTWWSSDGAASHWLAMTWE